MTPERPPPRAPTCLYARRDLGNHYAVAVVVVVVVALVKRHFHRLRERTRFDGNVVAAVAEVERAATGVAAVVDNCVRFEIQ